MSEKNDRNYFLPTTHGLALQVHMTELTKIIN